MVQVKENDRERKIVINRIGGSEEGQSLQWNRANTETYNVRNLCA